ncbi:CLUMA_CG021664, isoform A [Clunio marinus]|uniref:CLUMA_CG021664, isoform A n=1 Tax=Clunio marinus TaxID=568069 RepID=A0A1J1J7Y1_9DIPT|nr:CLUMA_CG021664, isoform A [Clunio marinus]
MRSTFSQLNSTHATFSAEENLVSEAEQSIGMCKHCERPNIERVEALKRQKFSSYNLVLADTFQGQFHRRQNVSCRFLCAYNSMRFNNSNDIKILNKNHVVLKQFTEGMNEEESADIGDVLECLSRLDECT